MRAAVQIQSEVEADLYIGHSKIMLTECREADDVGCSFNTTFYRGRFV